MSTHEQIERLRAEIDAKSAEIVELQTELHRLRPVADQVDGLRAELTRAKHDTVRAMSEVRRLETAARRDDDIQASNPDENGRRDWYWRGRYIGTYISMK